MTKRKRPIHQAMTSTSDKNSTMVPPEEEEEQQHQRRVGRNKPNKFLSKEEKEEKRRLKKQLKMQKRIKKLEIRMKHAICRKDPIVEEQARAELKALCGDGDEITNINGTIVSNSHDDNGATTTTTTKIGADFDQQQHIIAKTIIETIAKKLYQTLSGEINHIQSNTDVNVNTKHENNTNNTNHHDVTTTTTQIDEKTTTITKNHNNGNKQHQTKCAVELLKNMTKGTISLSMFDNKAALIGYTRQKFYERAMLFYTSMDKLRPIKGSKPKRISDKKEKVNGNDTNTDTDTHEESSSCSHTLTAQQKEIKDKIWDKIQNGQIRNSCSIGCGPGNDSLGLLTFLYCLNNDKNTALQSLSQSPSMLTMPSSSSTATDSEMKIKGLDKIILMDWSIQKWDNAVIKPLSSILKESNLMVNNEQQEQEQQSNNKSKELFNTCFCDVTKSFHDKSNYDARSAMENTPATNTAAAYSATPTSTNTPSCIDIYLTSYLLSETNGKWESFFDGLISAAKDESVFYFTEPNPWQLHRLIELFANKLDFLWTDSSMYYPSLQSLDARLGPAVLFAIKKSK